MKGSEGENKTTKFGGAGEAAGSPAAKWKLSGIIKLDLGTQCSPAVQPHIGSVTSVLCLPCSRPDTEGGVGLMQLLGFVVVIVVVVLLFFQVVIQQTWQGACCVPSPGLRI